MIKTICRITLLTVFCAHLVACSGMFDTDNTPKPSELKSINTEFTPRKLWSTSVGKNGNTWLRQTPAFHNNVLYTMNERGDVYAVNAENGTHLWSTALTGKFAAGPTAFQDTVIVASRTGHIYALSAANGKIKWEQDIKSEVLANPALNEDVVVIKTTDGQLRAFNAATGAKRFNFKQNEPNLILYGASKPHFQHNHLYVGFANGNLIKLNAETGKIMWLRPVAVPEGAFAIERMIDIDADPAPASNRVFAASYQGNIAAFDAKEGRTLWTHAISSYTGMTTDDDGLYITDASGVLWAFDARTGSERYRQTELTARGLSAPASFGQHVIVGDRLGFVHWFNKQNGRIVARMGLGSAILATPLVENNRLYVLTQNGHLSAYQL